LLRPLVAPWVSVTPDSVRDETEPETSNTRLPLFASMLVVFAAAPLIVTLAVIGRALPSR